MQTIRNHNQAARRALWGALAMGVTLSSAAALIGTASAQETAPSSATGMSASGTESASGPSVSSSGTVQEDTAGQVSTDSGGVVATGLRVSAGAGQASASVQDVRIGGYSTGPISATCQNGVAHTEHADAGATPEKLSVSYGPGTADGEATGATITVEGAGETAQTVTIATVSCGSAPVPPDDGGPIPPPGDDTPPDSDTPPSADEPGPDPDEGGDSGADESTEDELAPVQRPQPGHLPVTG